MSLICDQNRCRILHIRGGRVHRESGPVTSRAEDTGGVGRSPTTANPGNYICIFFQFRIELAIIQAQNPVRSTLLVYCRMALRSAKPFLREKNRCGRCTDADQNHRICCAIVSCTPWKNGSAVAAGPSRNGCRPKQLDQRNRSWYDMHMGSNLAAVRKKQYPELHSFRKGTLDLFSLYQDDRCPSLQR